MRKTIAFAICVVLLLAMCVPAFAEKTELYALDGRTIFVEENEVSFYTAEGMGWFSEKPVTMYAEDGRTIVVPADKVEAHKAVGWFVSGEENKVDEMPSELPENTTPVDSEEVVVKYVDGTFVKVPQKYVAVYELLGWEQVKLEFNQYGNVIVYNESGEKREITFAEVSRFYKEGWAFSAPGNSPVKPETPPVPDVNLVKMYYHDGSTKDVAENEIEAYKKKSWGLTYDEAVYSFAVFGDGESNDGAVSLLENKKYEFALSDRITCIGGLPT